MLYRYAKEFEQHSKMFLHRMDFQTTVTGSIFCVGRDSFSKKCYMYRNFLANIKKLSTPHWFSKCGNRITYVCQYNCKYCNICSICIFQFIIEDVSMFMVRSAISDHVRLATTIYNLILTNRNDLPYYLWVLKHLYEFTRLVSDTLYSRVRQIFLPNPALIYL